MLEIKKGDLFQSGCEALVNAANCRGAMGAGIARIFRERYPLMYNDYHDACSRNEVAIGRPHYWRNPDEGPAWIVNFPTMFYPGEVTQPGSIEEGLTALGGFLKENDVKSVAIPALGCGIGGFPWEDLKSMVVEWAEDFPGIRIVLYEPFL